MEQVRRSFSNKLLIIVGVVIIVGAVVAYFATVSTGPSSTDQSQISSFNSVVSSLSQQVQSLQQATTTLTKTLTSTSTTTSTVSGTGLATATVTVISTTTVTTNIGVTTTVGGTDFEMATATLAITSGTNGSGTLQVSVTNEGYDAIVGITVTIPTGLDNSTDLCSTSCSIQFAYNGTPLAPASPLTTGQTATGTTPTQMGVVGNTYNLTIAVSYDDGTQQTSTLGVTAQPS